MMVLCDLQKLGILRLFGKGVLKLSALIVVLASELGF